MVGPLTFRLAREFGFCYGVDRAVEYAYETRTKFPGRRLFLVGEIIHNPHVNQKLRDMGITLLAHQESGEFDFSGRDSGRCGDHAGIRGDDPRLRAAPRHRVRAGGHHLRLGA